MIVEQFPYLSPEACKLRQRDGTPPYGVHVCEVDSFPDEPGDLDSRSRFWAALRRARELRATIEAEIDTAAGWRSRKRRGKVK